MSNLINRQEAIDALAENMPSTYTPDGSHPADEGIFMAQEVYADCIQTLKELPSAQPDQRWIPCSEKLPEEDVEVLISYHYKDGEGDTSHIDIDITTYGQMYFGGNKVGNHKHWRAPFEYFESNYEVVAWMPLPKPYREDKTCQTGLKEQ